MPALVPLVLNVTQIGLCLWAGTYSYAAVTRLQQYEDTSEKAAKISTTAAQELHKTRTTQTAGALSIIVALVWSCTLLSEFVSTDTLFAQGLSSAVTAGVLVARSYISNFWTPKSGVPLVKNYNEGIENSKNLVQVLEYLALTSALQAVHCTMQLVFRG